MTQLLQLLVVVAGLSCLVIYGLIRDKKEHPDSPQTEIYFPEHPSENAEKRHQGAAMSRL
jgi:hypothetical protein